MQKFLRLLDYLKKLVPQKDAPEMDVKIVSNSNRQEDVLVSKYIKSADRVKRFIIQLRKGTRDKYEWLELVLDATFDTQQAFRIDINWLVASGSKVYVASCCIAYVVKSMTKRPSKGTLKTHLIITLSSLTTDFSMFIFLFSLTT